MVWNSRKICTCTDIPCSPDRRFKLLLDCIDELLSWKYTVWISGFIQHSLGVSIPQKSENNPLERSKKNRKGFSNTPESRKFVVKNSLKLYYFSLNFKKFLNGRGWLRPSKPQLYVILALSIVFKVFLLLWFN